ncbi:MAG TPA: hypothetical protein VD735_07010 [Candidatus Saccharimonadales bacterium]|nr:hypothetical protein [Candidatus Saccharimonadales bacterium]
MDTDPHRDSQDDNPYDTSHMTPEQRAAHEAADRQARIDYLRSLTPEKKRKPVWVKILLSLLLVVALGVLATVLYSKLVDTNKDDGSLQTKPVKTAQQKEVEDVPVRATKPYSSATFNMTIMHPEGWTATENAGVLKIVSPATKMRAVSGKEMKGQVTVTFSGKGQNLAAFDAGNATAVIPSEKLTYTQPTSVQRAQTYLSFAQYAATTAGSAALDALYVTGDYGYQVDQAIPKIDMANLDPLISVTFASCNDSACKATTPMSIGAGSWRDKAFSVPIISTLESLAIN